MDFISIFGKSKSRVAETEGFLCPFRLRGARPVQAKIANSFKFQAW